MPQKLSFVLFLFLAYSSTAQFKLETPAPSPYASEKLVIGSNEVSVEYYRIRKRGRVWFGEQGAMAPYGKIWRTGANSGTKVKFSKDVLVQGMSLEKGEYLILSWPGRDSWDVAFYSDISLGGDVSRYDQKMEKLKINVKSKPITTQETLTIELAPINSDGLSLLFYFDEVLLTIPIQFSDRFSQPPVASIKQVLGISDLQIDYTSVGSLVEGKVGILSIEHDAQVAGESIPAGTYNMIYSKLDGSITFQSQNKTIMTKPGRLAVDMKPLLSSNFMNIMFHSVSDDNKTAGIRFFDKTNQYIIPLTIDHVPQVTKLIEGEMNAQQEKYPYFAAASYYLDNGLDMNKALGWIDKAAAENPAYWVLYLKGRILDRLARYDEATAVLDRALMSAKDQKNADYQKMITDLISAINSKLAARPNVISQTAKPAAVVPSDYKNFSTKVALVIGVRDYKYVQPLQNPLNDAQDMSATLKRKGFTVIQLLNPKTKREVQDAIRKYLALLIEDKNSVGLMYYSGHGMQVDGVNYLIPTDADPQIKADLDDQCLNMDYIMQAMESADNSLNIFILDACRNNPFRSLYRSSDRGLSMVFAPKGSYIIFATKPGSVASDGAGRNGLFTSKLIRWIDEPNLSIDQVVKYVAADVSKDSGDAQRPWWSSDFIGDFYFTLQP
jgi:tetratricopeptide (TPR) repeat protein